MNATLTNLALWFWKTEPIEFTYPAAVVEKVKKILLVFPRNGNEKSAKASKIIDSLRPRQTEVLTFGGVEFTDIPTIMVNEKEIKFGHFISGEIINHIKQKEFDFVVDLSPQFDFVTAQLGLRAKIPLRAGFGANYPWAHRFFNIIFKASPEDQFDLLVKFLSENKGW